MYSGNGGNRKVNKLLATQPLGQHRLKRPCLKRPHYVAWHLQQQHNLEFCFATQTIQTFIPHTVQQRRWYMIQSGLNYWHTTIPHTVQQRRWYMIPLRLVMAKRSWDSGHRSLCLVHAKDALLFLSHTTNRIYVWFLYRLEAGTTDALHNFTEF